MSVGDFITRGGRLVWSLASSLAVVESFFDEPLTPRMVAWRRWVPVFIQLPRGADGKLCSCDGSQSGPAERELVSGMVALDDGDSVVNLGRARRRRIRRCRL